MTRPDQKIVERQQVEMALRDLRVPYTDLINNEAPDFWLCLQGRKIAIEHTEYNSSTKYRQFEEEWINLRSKIEAWNFGGNLYLDFRDQAPIERRDRKSFKKELKSLLKDHQSPETAVETTAGSSCTDSADLQRDEPLRREDKNLIEEEILPSFDEAQNTETVYKDFSDYPCLQQYLNSLGLTKTDITTVGSNLDGGWFGVTYDEISNIMCKKGRKLHEKLHKAGISAPRWLVVVSSAHRRSACTGFTNILIGKLNANPDNLKAAITASGFEKIIICPSFEGQGYAVSCNGQPFEEVAYSE